MNVLSCLTILALSALNLAQASQPPSTIDDDVGVNIQNFDSQVIAIFKAVVEHPKPSPFSPETGASAVGDKDQRMVLKKILAKFTDHKMLLKNVVYRTDTDVIRVTWGDLKNDSVVKITYKTGRDKVLSNSLYADKNAVFDVKIIYRKPNSQYDYLRLVNLESMKFTEDATPIEHNGYFVEYKLSNEECRFCHILAKHDGSPSGLFFPRYQEGQGSSRLEGISAFFDPSKLELKKSAESVPLGLPEMKDDFYFFQTTKLGTLDKDTEKILRALVELPQLLEVMSMDNRKSYCLLIDTGEIGEKLGLGRDDYICADNVGKKLHVKMTNDTIFNHKDPVIYTEPYFKK